MPLPAAYTAVVHYSTLLLFGVAGVMLNAFCLLTAWWPASVRSERFFQRVIHRLFVVFVAWLEWTRVVRVEYRGVEFTPGRGLVVVANHPSLLDAILLLARFPEARCIFKNALRRNPVFGLAAWRAGYLANDGGLHLVRVATEKVAAGETLIVFPEGTRTPVGEAVGPFRPGFAAIARHAGAPIQLVRIACEPAVLGKGRAWWKLPKLPARVVVQAGPRLDSAFSASAAVLAAEAEAWFHATGGSARPEPAPAEHPAGRTFAVS